MDTVRALSIILKPYLARERARALPIPSDEPVMKAHVPAPYRFLRSFLLRISLYSLDSNVHIFRSIIMAPIISITIVVLGHTYLIAYAKFMCDKEAQDWLSYCDLYDICTLDITLTKDN